MPVGNRRCGRWRDHRQVIDGIPHRVRTGFRWRDLPERCCLWRAHLGRLHQRPRIGSRSDQSVTGRHSASRATMSRQARSAWRGW
ncbi:MULTISPECIES: transposase [Streptomyces]|uniref:transposase n=2 Tax=Streptomyces TaxID=1883 RepID=UPI0022772B3C|nr:MULTISPECIES: transposase [unclassified Streptomyces]